MDETLYTIGPFTITPFSVAVCVSAIWGCIVLLLLSGKKHIRKNTAFSLMPLTILLGVFLGHALYAALRVLIYPLDYEQPLVFVLNPGVGGFMFFGVLAGAALSCLIVSGTRHYQFSQLMSVLFPALLITLAFIRFAEPLCLLGKGPETEGGFFPLSYAPEAEYPEDRYIPEFFYAGLYTLLIGIWNIRSILTKHGKKRSTLFFFVLYLAGQMFFEVFRQDEYVNATSLITFIRLNQLIAVILLGVCLVYAIKKCMHRVSAGFIIVRCLVFVISVGACIGLQFLFDKPLPLMGETIWFPDWLVYVLLALSAVGMGWPIVSMLSRKPNLNRSRS